MSNTGDAWGEGRLSLAVELYEQRELGQGVEHLLHVASVLTFIETFLADRGLLDVAQATYEARLRDGRVIGFEREG